MKAASKPKCSQHDEKYEKKKKAITDEEGDVQLKRFDLAFCSIDHMDPTKQGQMHKGGALAEQDGWF